MRGAESTYTGGRDRGQHSINQGARRGITSISAQFFWTFHGKYLCNINIKPYFNLRTRIIQHHRLVLDFCQQPHLQEIFVELFVDRTEEWSLMGGNWAGVQRWRLGRIMRQDRSNWGQAPEEKQAPKTLVDQVLKAKLTKCWRIGYIIDERAGQK